MTKILDQAEYRRTQKFIEPCLSPEDLDEFIQSNFGIELPWHSVDEKSTSNALQVLWDVNYAMLTNTGVNRHVMAVARNGGKTLVSAIIQFIALIHYRRDGIHLAATLDQSRALIKYIDKFLKHPLVAPYSQIDNVREKILTGLPPNDFTIRPDASLVVATATKKGTNSQRSSILTADEIDLTPKEILAEFAFIADPSRIIRPNGKHEKFDPVFVYLSSRKTNDGPVQDLIDEAESPEQDELDPIKLHKWSAVDWQQKCPPEIHKPEKGGLNAYIHTEKLETIWGDDHYEDLSETEQTQYEKYPAFQGCMKCPAWAACLGRAPKQKGLSPMLRTRKFISTVVRAVKDPAAIIAQALNWKPESTGLVFRNFSAYHHIKDSRHFYEWVTFGKSFDPDNIGEEEVKRILNHGTYKENASITPTKEQIYDAMTEHGWAMVSGVDWGHSPDPAVCVVLGYHKKFQMTAVLHVDHAYEHANHIWAEVCANGTLERFPVEFVAPDQADPSSVTYFSKFGITSLGKKSKPKRIGTGISFLRGMVWDASSNSSKFAILDDGDGEKCNIFMIEEMKKYSHARNAVGDVQFDKFEDKNNHAIDATRYALHPFTINQKVRQSTIQFASLESKKELMDQVSRNNPEAIQAVRDKAEFQAQFSELMRDEHGLTNVFVKPEVDQRVTSVDGKNTETGRKPKKSKNKSGIKFSI